MYVCTHAWMDAAQHHPICITVKCTLLWAHISVYAMHAHTLSNLRETPWKGPCPNRSQSGHFALPSHTLSTKHSQKETTYSLHCSSFLGLSFWILNTKLVKPKKGTAMETIGRSHSVFRCKECKGSRFLHCTKNSTCYFYRCWGGVYHTIKLFYGAPKYSIIFSAILSDKFLDPPSTP